MELGENAIFQLTGATSVILCTCVLVTCHLIVKVANQPWDGALIILKIMGMWMLLTIESLTKGTFFIAISLT